MVIVLRQIGLHCIAHFRETPMTSSRDEMRARWVRIVTVHDGYHKKCRDKHDRQKHSLLQHSCKAFPWIAILPIWTLKVNREIRVHVVRHRIKRNCMSKILLITQPHCSIRRPLWSPPFLQLCSVMSDKWCRFTQQCWHDFCSHSHSERREW